MIVRFIRNRHCCKKGVVVSTPVGHIRHSCLAWLGPLQRSSRAVRNRHSFLNFIDVCPEPALVKIWQFLFKMAQKDAFSYLRRVRSVRRDPYTHAESL
jgi:hypothetical protein